MGFSGILKSKNGKIPTRCLKRGGICELGFLVLYHWDLLGFWHKSHPVV